MRQKGVRKEQVNNLGRASKNQAELMTRRLKEYELWVSGISICEIARQYNLSPVAVGNDVKAIANLEPYEDAKQRIDAQFKDLVRIIYNRITTDETVTHPQRAAYIHELNESLKTLARIHGLDKGDTYNISSTNIITGVQIYDKWDDSRIQEEFKRRRLELHKDSESTSPQ
jgi:hypothetical protein